MKFKEENYESEEEDWKSDYEDEDDEDNWQYDSH
jgi:hypothetical protein